MSIQAILHFDGKQLNIHQVQYGFKQNADDTGRPSYNPRFIGLDLVVEATKDNDFWEWVIHNYLAKQIKIQFIPRLMGSKSRIVEFIDAHCIHYTLNYNSTNTELVTITLKITAAGVKDHSTGTMFEEHWLTTRPANVAVTQKEENKKVIEYYLTDEEGNAIEEYEAGQIIILNIETANRIGDKMNVRLNDKEHDFKYEGSLLKNDTIKDFVVSSDVEKIELEVIDQQEPV